MTARMIGALSALLLCGTALSAQTGSPQVGPADRVVQSFAECRAITVPDARLGCFDKAAAALDRAIASKEVTIVDRQQVRKAQRSLFGFTIPRLPLFGGGHDGDEPAKQDEFTELNTTIKSAVQVENGRVQLRLAEGDAVWVTTDPMPFPPHPGDKIRIRRGALGNYFLAIAGQRSVRGLRIR